MIPTVFIGLATVSFFFGTPLYRFQKPRGSPITRVCQVLVAAYHKLNLKIPEETEHFCSKHWITGRLSIQTVSSKSLHSNFLFRIQHWIVHWLDKLVFVSSYRFFDKVAIIFVLLLFLYIFNIYV